MSMGSRLLAVLAKLPPPRSRDIAVEEDLRVPMPDGVTLLADRYFARSDSAAPIVLIRSPYGRKRLIGILGRVFAERGYQTVIQSCRGTFGSGGEFDPFRYETSDGRATLDWLMRQPWSSDAVGMFGASYVGSTQWAVAADAPPYVKALAPSITASDPRPLIYPGGGFALETHVTWLDLVADQEGPLWRVLIGQATQGRRLSAALAHLPLAEVDRLAVGKRVQHFQDWLVHEDPEDPWWRQVDWSRDLEAVDAPVALVAGWYDLFTPEQLRDYRRLREAGKTVRLVVGPWRHVDLGTITAALREALGWFDIHLRRDGALARRPVRVFVMGSGRWLELDDWPPPSTPTRWHLHPNDGLAEASPGNSAPDRYRYDPADPTPSVGGTMLGAHAGPRDNRRLEARPDVRTFTSAVLDADLEVVGPVTAELYVRSTREFTDFFVRVCDVHPSGRSINVCDGLIRLRAGSWDRRADGSARLEVELWPTAYRFKRGHRVRVQVSSGAHPRFVRNLGLGEPLGAGARSVIAEQEIFHDAAHPSAVVLPVYSE
jgi:hypothetical protein